ncbi:HD domain-containing protein [Halobacillus litoralis]|uniref:HD-GYP domain-containing protein n=1 Tax=Halobacillus litoralis TaxID=45668 RepID=UPI001CD29C42|nr:HD domain-containing phosphohydrolase [Halobacillus litoralis]MCA0971788.1 HD domain-containing protein [Halobacillus litoralis]
MRYASIDKIQQNDQLGKNIYADDGRILLNKGVTFTVGIISRLKNMGVEAVYLMDSEGIEVEQEDSFDEETKREVMANLSSSFDYIQSGKDFNPQKIGKSAEKIMDELMHSKDVLLHMNDIRTTGNQLLIHSTHVAIMSVLIGMKMGYTPKDLKELGTGALLHDVGKSAPDQPGRENHHTWKGFNILRQSRELSTLVAHVAFQHHERLDGSGEPRGITEEKVHAYAKVVSIANDYDNLVAPMDGSEPLMPYEACEKILSYTGEWYDHDMVWQFLRSIAIYPNGSNVRLSNGKYGTVTAQNKGLPQRPVVRAFQNNELMNNYDVEVIDLSKETTVFIDKVMSD